MATKRRIGAEFTFATKGDQKLIATLTSIATAMGLFGGVSAVLIRHISKLTPAIKKWGTVLLLAAGAVYAIKKALDAFIMVVQLAIRGIKALAAAFVDIMKDYIKFREIAVSAGYMLELTTDSIHVLAAATAPLGTTMKEAAKSLEEFGRAGFTASEGIAAYAPTMMFATVAGTNLGRATTLVSGAMRTFNFAAEDAWRVVSGFTNAILESRMSFETLETAFSYAGAAGKAFGQTFEHTVAVVMAFRNMGLKASTAGTVLRRSLAMINKKARAGHEIFKKYGIAANEAAISATHTFGDFIKELAQANVGSKELVDDMGELVGSRFGAYVAALVQLTKEAGEGVGTFKTINELTGLVIDKNTQLLDAYNTRIHDISGLMKVASSEIEVFWNGIARLAEPLVSSALYAFDTVLHNINKELGFIDEHTFENLVKAAEKLDFKKQIDKFKDAQKETGKYLLKVRKAFDAIVNYMLIQYTIFSFLHKKFQDVGKAIWEPIIAISKGMSYLADPVTIGKDIANWGMNLIGVGSQTDLKSAMKDKEEENIQIFKTVLSDIKGVIGKLVDPLGLGQAVQTSAEAMIKGVSVIGEAAVKAAQPGIDKMNEMKYKLDPITPDDMFDLRFPTTMVADMDSSIAETMEVYNRYLTKRGPGGTPLMAKAVDASKWTQDFSLGGAGDSPVDDMFTLGDSSISGISAHARAGAIGEGDSAYGEGAIGDLSLSDVMPGMPTEEQLETAEQNITEEEQLFNLRYRHVKDFLTKSSEVTREKETEWEKASKGLVKTFANDLVQGMLSGTAKMKDIFSNFVKAMIAKAMELLVIKTIMKSIGLGFSGGSSILGAGKDVGGSGLDTSGSGMVNNAFGSPLQGWGGGLTGTDSVPAMLGPREIVFDDNASNAFRQLLASGDSLGGGGGKTYNITFNVNALDSKDVIQNIRKPFLELIQNDAEFRSEIEDGLEGKIQ